MAVELFGEGDEVDGLLAFAERDHLGEDAAVLVQEEIFGLEIFDGGVEGVVVEDYGAEDGTLCVEIIGERLFENGVGGHASSFVFALFSPTVTHSPFTAQDHLHANGSDSINSGGEDDCLGSTDSLFEALAHCARKSGARQYK
jgi:hypothetical protein